MKVAWLALLTGLGAGELQESNRPRPSQESATVRYKEVPEIVDEIAREVRKHEKALVVWLVDHTAQFKTSRHAELLGRHIAAAFRDASTRHALFVFGERPAKMLDATADVDLLAASLRGVAEFMPPDESVKNGLLNIREAAIYAAGASGIRKFLVVFTQTNGDNEDDLEGTLAILKKVGVSLYSIAPEAMYSDPLWDSFLTKASRFGPELDPVAFKKLPFQLKGPESAYIEFPYGWPYVWFDPTYTVPSGFGAYGLDRLSSHTGGKYFMYSIDRPTRTFCQFQPDQRACPTCVGRHKACGASFDATKLLLTSPEIGSRAEYLARYSTEPLYLANLNTWARLHHEGILRGEPQLEGALGENRGARGPRQGSVRTGNLTTIRRGALRDAEVVLRLVADLHETEKKLGAQADRRVLATNDALVVHYRMLVETFKQVAAFCEELDRVSRAGAVAASPPDAFAKSEFEEYIGKTIDGFTFHNLFLCHGGSPLKSVKFLGDLKGLHETLDLADRMIDKHRGTPWEILIRRACLPVFTPHFLPGGPGKVEKPKAQSSGQNAATTQAQTRPQRPARGAADNGASAGTRTGP